MIPQHARISRAEYRSRERRRLLPGREARPRRIPSARGSRPLGGGLVLRPVDTLALDISGRRAARMDGEGGLGCTVQRLRARAHCGGPCGRGQRLANDRRAVRHAQLGEREPDRG